MTLFRSKLEPLRPDEVQKRYEATLKEMYKGMYEHARWFATPALRAQYDMMRETIERHTFTLGVRGSYLEVGPGTGTWTKCFLEHNPKLHCTLVDISSKMLAMARKQLATYSHTRFIESDFTHFESDTSYDFFFSSRAIEYVPDKTRFVRIAYEVLRPGGRGMIITKVPKHIEDMLTGRRRSRFHSGQIAISSLRTLLCEAGFRNVHVYPAIVIIPFFRSVLLNWIAWRSLSWLPMNPISSLLCEAYAVTFEKTAQA